MKLCHVISAGFALLLFVGCEEFQKTTSFPSPDNKYVVDVTVGYQAANDPEVWWQHVSLRKGSDPVLKGRGNLLVYSSHKEPLIKWKDGQTLEVTARDVGQTLDAVKRSPVQDEITFDLVVERSQAKPEDK